MSSFLFSFFVDANATLNGGAVIDEEALMKAIEDELDAEEAEGLALQTSPDAPVSPSVLLNFGAGDEDDDDDEDEEEEDDEDDDMNQEHMMEILRGSLAAISNEDFNDGDESEEDDEEYVPAMPNELLRAFRRASIGTPQFVPSTATVAEDEEEN
jgi:hypothetical protein